MLQLLFPIPVYLSSDITPLEDCEKLFSKCDMLKPTDSGVLTTLSEYFGSFSVTSWNVKLQPESISLINTINSATLMYLKLRDVKPYDISITNLWLNSMGQDSVHPPHRHYASTLSGVYYVNVPEGSGKLLFHSPLIHTGYPELRQESEINITNSHLWWLPVETGSIVIFPSYLDHSVPRMEFMGTRKSIAFDIDLIPINNRLRHT